MYFLNLFLSLLSPRPSVSAFNYAAAANVLDANADLMIEIATALGEIMETTQGQVIEARFMLQKFPDADPRDTLMLQAAVDELSLLYSDLEITVGKSNLASEFYRDLSGTLRRAAKGATH